MIALLFVMAGDWTLLQDAAEGVAQINCHFTQEKRSPLFKQTMRSTGTIRVAYGELHLKMEQPDKMQLDVSGDKAAITQDGKREEVPIDKLPKVQSFLGAFSELFLGRTESLQKIFTLDSTRRDGDGTTASLVPKDTGILQRVTVTFTDGTAQKILLSEDSGDETSIALSQCKVTKH
jgi:Outer membrane lipoprotein carrier protein LolA